MSASQLLLLIVALLVVLVVVGLVVAAARKRRRRAELRDTFGSEYDRTVDSTGKRGAAERELAERKQRHDALTIRPLSTAARQRYLTAWDGVQTRFIDQPVLALSEADHLVTQVMADRGYPTDGVRTQADMLSVEHSRVLDSFRAGHAIEQANRSDSSDTEQVRQGMLHFRAVFEELVGDDAADPYPSAPDGASAPRRDDAELR
jgi:hypothetical protein